MTLVPCGFLVNSWIYNNRPKYRLMNQKTSICRKLCRANPQTSITYYQSRYPSLLDLLNQATELTSWQRTQLLPVSSVKTTKRVAIQKRDWAHVVDVNKPMKNFHTLVPNLARKVGHFSVYFPFPAAR
jgi:hypothetical protein